MQKNIAKDGNGRKERGRKGERKEGREEGKDEGKEGKQRSRQIKKTPHKITGVLEEQSPIIRPKGY